MTDSRVRSYRDVINFGSVRVAGVGGLPLLAFAAVLAINFPRIGWPAARSWPLASSSTDAGADR